MMSKHIGEVIETNENDNLSGQLTGLDGGQMSLDSPTIHAPSRTGPRPALIGSD